MLLLRCHLSDHDVAEGFIGIATEGAQGARSPLSESGLVVRFVKKTGEQLRGEKGYGVVLDRRN